MIRYCVNGPGKVTPLVGDAVLHILQSDWLDDDELDDEELDDEELDDDDGFDDDDDEDELDDDEDVLGQHDVI